MQKFLSSGLFLEKVRDENLFAEFLEEIILNIGRFAEISRENSGFLVKLLNLCLIKCLEFYKVSIVIEILLDLLIKF